MIESVDVIHGAAVAGPRTCVLYEILLHFSDSRPTHSILHSYERFFDLKAKISSKHELRGLDENFPRALKRSTFGVPISKHQNDLRCNLLNTWLNRVMEQSHTFPPDVMQSLSVFLNLPLSLLTYKPSAVKFDDAATIDQHLQLEALIEQAQNILTSNVHVIVRRGEAACAVRGSVDCAPDPHPVFETLVQYDTLKPVYVAARRFDAYRRLFMDLYKGLAPLLCVCIHASMISSAAAWKGLFDEHRAQTALEEDLLKLEGQFPRTFKRSLFGIKLSDADLDNRCAGLNYWMSGILSRYYLLDIERRALVNDFLKLNTPKNVEEDERNKAILHALSSKRTRDSSMCTEGTIVYTQDTAVMSPGIAMPHRSSDEFSIPSVCEIPVEEVDYECTTLRAAPTRDPVTGDTLGDGQPTVFAFGPEEHHRQSNDTLETIRIESSENESRTTLHSTGSAMRLVSIDSAVRESSGIGLNDKYEYADEYFLSDEGLDRETDDRPSDGFLSEEELCKFAAAREQADKATTSSRAGSKEECIIS